MCSTTSAYVTAKADEKNRTSIRGDEDDRNGGDVVNINNKQQQKGEQKHSCKRDTWPEVRDPSIFWMKQIFRNWTYSYMDPLLWKGSKQSSQDATTNLVQEDLYPVPLTMESENLARNFWKYYEEASGRKRRLIMTLWRLAKPTFVPAGFCQLVAVLVQVAMPLLVRQLLMILERNPYQKVIKEGMPYAISIFVSLFINAIANHRHRHLAMKTGVVMRAAVVSILYEHVLRLTPSGRTGLTSGEVANHVAVDTQKLFEVAQEGHLIWSLPLSIALVTIFLVLISGPVTLVGIAVLISFVPVVERITSRVLAIRQERVGWTDKRIEISNAMLQGIKTTKLNNYEDNYEKRLAETREKELKCLCRELAVWASTLFMTVISPVVATAATFSIYVLVNPNNVLTAAQTFSVLMLFSALRFPINFAGKLLGKAAQALSAVDRITIFLKRETRPEDFGHLADSEQDNSDLLEKTNPPLTLANAAFRVGSDLSTDTDTSVASIDQSTRSSSGFTVSQFDLSVKKGEVLAVCGPVGCGKSLLINGIIDELPPASAETVVTTKGRVAYVPQTPFILNTTVRDNILFGLPFHQDLYERVLDACCLKPDLDQLGKSRDLTEIGERGVTLSGGQKQRVSLARAAYSQPDLVLLDDPLSALDAGTAKMVFERLIKSPAAYFANTAIVLVTHASHFLNRVDRIMVIVDGRNQFLGTWNQLASHSPTDLKTRSAIDFIRHSVQEKESKEKDLELEETVKDDGSARGLLEKSVLMTAEQREHGLSSLNTWLLWFKHAGGLVFLSTLTVLLALDRFMYVATEYWLARWTDGADAPVEVFGIYFPPQTEGRSAQYKYLAVYASIVLVSILATFARSEYSVRGGSRAARIVFTKMLTRVLKAPVSYFESTPMGRVLNRFTYDTEVVDVVLTQNMSMFLISTSWYFTGVILMITILYYTALIIFPVTFMYYMLLLHYRKSGPDLQRLDAVSRSPIQAMVTEALDGCSSIRVFKKELSFVERFRSKVNKNSSALLNFVTAQRWLGVRIELLGSAVVLVASVLVVCLNDVFLLEPGIVGLLIIWSSNFTITLGFLVDTFGEAEAAITAIERVDAMSRLPQEKAMTTDEKNALPTSWPEKGSVVFDNVCLRYRDGLPLALNNLSFAIPPGKSCGVVGRTGAGKSSLTVALFRLVEIESGKITLDGIDLSEIGLSDVRGRGMTIIPQDPFLVGSTLRECLDPFGESDDTEILESLNAVGLGSGGGDGNTMATLDAAVHEGGSNYSVGERQLLNLARALLSKPKVLVLDEATASIDAQTDSFIQNMLRTRFTETTILTVAHRLNTIMDYDLILVMDAGRAVEFGPPSQLLSDNGVFAELVAATGPESASALREMASGSSNKAFAHTS